MTTNPIIKVVLVFPVYWFTGLSDLDFLSLKPLKEQKYSIKNFSFIRFSILQELGIKHTTKKTSITCTWEWRQRQKAADSLACSVHGVLAPLSPNHTGWIQSCCCWMFSNCEREKALKRRKQKESRCQMEKHARSKIDNTTFTLDNMREKAAETQTHALLSPRTMTLDTRWIIIMVETDLI